MISITISLGNHFHRVTTGDHLLTMHNGQSLRETQRFFTKERLSQSHYGRRRSIDNDHPAVDQILLSVVELDSDGVARAVDL